MIAGEQHRTSIALLSDDDVRRFHPIATAAKTAATAKPVSDARYHNGYYAAIVLGAGGNDIQAVTTSARPGRSRAFLALA